MENTELLQQFIATFSSTHRQGVELRISSKEVRQFISESGSNLSFRAFNKLTGCLGCTTGNLYAYSIPALQGKLVEHEVRSEREFSDSRIMTLNWYGSKRTWIQEWEVLYQHMSQSFGCSQVIDIFGGSGFLSLLAARTGVFERVVLNDCNSRVYNYHMVMKSESAFNSFTDRLELLGDINREAFELIYADLYGTSDTVAGREGRRQVKRVSIRQAVELFVIRHYSFNGQGNWVGTRKSPSSYIEALGRTHRLYENITLKHILYKKLLKEHIQDEGSLIILDPPYVTETRAQKQSYGIEFSIRQESSGLPVPQHPIKGKTHIKRQQEQCQSLCQILEKVLMVPYTG